MTHQTSPLTSRRVLPLLLLWLSGTSACTKFASELDEMATPELSPGADWSCLSQAAGNPIMPTNGPPLDYRVAPRDYINGNTPPNLRVRACYRADVTCSHPATDFVLPDEDGSVTVPLTVGFNGYLEVLSDDMVPTISLFPGPMTQELADAVGSVTLALLPLDALVAFAVASQIELSPDLGVVSVNAYDCAGPSAPGVRLELNTSGVPYQFVDGLPIAYEDTTNAESSGGFANVQPGLVVVKGFRAGTVDLVGLETVLVRAQWVTVTSLMPQFAAE